MVPVFSQQVKGIQLTCTVLNLAARRVYPWLFPVSTSAAKISDMKMKMWQLMVITIMMVAAIDAQGSSCQTAKGSPGRCISIRECPELLILLQESRASSGSIDVLRSSICDLSNVIRVCCPVSENSRKELLPSRCGVSDLTDRIVNGQDAPLLAWPWMALLRGRGAAGSNWICGAVLISERYVLTAAHCVHSSSGQRLEFVRIGEHTLSRNPDCEVDICAPEPQDIPVEEIIVHEQYRNVTRCPRCHDIALLRLIQPAVLNELHVVPICLPLNLETDLNAQSRNDLNSRIAWVAGWGTVDPLRLKIPDVLQYVSLPIDDRFCGRQRGAYPDPDMVICAGGSERKDSCQGDSGGPLILINQRSRSYVVGIVSQGPVICGAERTQGLYTNVHHYVSWILKNLRP